MKAEAGGALLCVCAAAAAAQNSQIAAHTQHTAIKQQAASRSSKQQRERKRAAKRRTSRRSPAAGKATEYDVDENACISCIISSSSITTVPVENIKKSLFRITTISNYKNIGRLIEILLILSSCNTF